jgi:hypothetical protein
MDERLESTETDSGVDESSDMVDADLLQRAWKLLQPGDIELDGLVVATDIDSDNEPEMHQHTVDIGDTIAEYAGFEPTETFVYSGTDDSEFASNQHQGLTLDDEEFVWECQQLYRDGSFDVVFYFQADIDTEGLLSALDDRDVTYVRGDTDSPSTSVVEN